MIVRKYLNNTIYVETKASKIEVMACIRINEPEIKVYKLEDRIGLILDNRKIEIVLKDNKNLTWDDLNDIIKYKEIITNA